MSQAEEEVTPSSETFVSKLYHEGRPQRSAMNVSATLKFLGQALEYLTFYDLKLNDEHGVAMHCILDACADSLEKVCEEIPEEVANG